MSTVSGALLETIILLLPPHHLERLSIFELIRIIVTYRGLIHKIVNIIISVNFLL